MSDTCAHTELFIDIVTRGQFRKDPDAPSEHDKRHLTNTKFEDGLLNSFIGFLSEAAFEDHFESFYEEGILLDGGWFISKNYNTSPLESPGVYLTVTSKPKERLISFYSHLNKHYSGKLYVFEKKAGFLVNDLTSDSLDDLRESDIFDVFEFRNSEFIRRQTSSFTSYFKPIPEKAKERRKKEMQSKPNDNLKDLIAQYHRSAQEYRADHETKFLDRLLIDHFFLPHKYKGDISDIDFVLDWGNKFEMVDVKAKYPSEIEAYGINKRKLYIMKAIDTWENFSRKYVINKENISNEPKHLHSGNWLVADLTSFIEKGRETEGKSGRSQSDFEKTVELEIEGNFQKLL